jgi:uncharacterized protein (DUF736 family)
VLKVDVKIVPAEKENEKAPDYRIFSGTVEFGSAWKRTSGAGPEYFSVKLAVPSLPKPSYASLIAVGSGEAYSLIWSRRNMD